MLTAAQPERWPWLPQGTRYQLSRVDGEGREEAGAPSPALPRRLTACIIIPAEPVKLLVFIVLQITQLRAGGLEGPTLSHQF